MQLTAIRESGIAEVGLSGAGDYQMVDQISGHIVNQFDISWPVHQWIDTEFELMRITEDEALAVSKMTEQRELMMRVFNQQSEVRMQATSGSELTPDTEYDLSLYMAFMHNKLSSIFIYPEF